MSIPKFKRDRDKPWDITTKMRAEIHQQLIKERRVAITPIAFKQGFPQGEFDLRVFCAMYNFKWRERKKTEDSRIAYVLWRE